jgi:SSS family solute:Na+ symporter
METMSYINWLLIAGYFIINIIIGIRSRSFTKTAEGFFLAHRQLSHKQTTATLTATAIGGSATILVIGTVYAKGLPFVWTDIAGGAGLILLGLFLAKKVRRTGSFSLPEIVGRQYGIAAQKLAAVLVLIAEIGFLSLILRGTIGLLSPYIPLPESIILLIVGFSFILYTILGGQLAVARTDALQVAVMVVGIGILMVFCLLMLLSGSTIAAEKLAFPTSQNYPPISVISLILIAGLPHLVGSDIYSKVLSARNAEVAARSSIAAGLTKIVIGLMVAFIGLVAAAVLPAGLMPDQVLSNLLSTALPQEVAIVVVIAFLATLMSSADSILITSATVVTKDILQSENDLALKQGKYVVLFVGTGGMLMAVQFPNMLSSFIFAYTLFSASLVVPVLAGFWRKQLAITTIGAWAAMSGGAIAVITTSLLGWTNDATILTGLAICTTLLFTVSWISRLLGAES